MTERVDVKYLIRTGVIRWRSGSRLSDVDSVADRGVIRLSVSVADLG